MSSLRVDHDCIPQILKDIKNWSNWKSEPKSSGTGFTKVPYVAGANHRASYADPKDYRSYSQAVESDPEHLGFCFRPELGLIALDLDGCRDSETGSLTAWAKEIITQANSYCEVTPSKSGVRVWFRGTMPTDAKKDHFYLDLASGYGGKVEIQIFSVKGYVTVTGNGLDSVDPLKFSAPISMEIEQRDPENIYQLILDIAKRYPRPAKEKSSAVTAAASSQKEGSGIWTVKDSKLAEKKNSKMETLLHGQVGCDKPFQIEDATWSVEYPSQSEADYALLGFLVNKHGKNRDAGWDEFVSSPLYRDKYDRNRLFDHEWTKLLDAQPAKATKDSASDAKPTAAKKEKSAAAVMEDPEVKSPLLVVPAYPMNTIDGDLIGECTRVLTVGTFIPPQFMRENIKTALGLILDGLVGYPNHTDIHLREYLHNVSQFPQSGKGESWKRSVANGTGFLAEMLKKFGVNVTDGGVFGSGEYMVKRLNDSSGGRVLARFDEMSAVWTKTKTAGNIIEKMFLQLYEGGTAAQGSFKNGSHAVVDFHYAHVGDFTRDSFDASFTGSGSRGSGYLSRCVFQFAEKQPWEGDWLNIDISKAQPIVGAIQEKIEWVRSYEPQQDKGESRLILIEDDDAKALRLDFYKWLDTQDSRFTPRIKDHLKRDAILRAVFSNGDSHITGEAMQRSIDWSKNQLDTRLAIFPEDVGSATEIMERLILKCVSSGNASERDLKTACHVNRPGSGGHEAFNRALRSLIFGHEIAMVGKNRKGLPIYAAFGEDESLPKS